jgi:hypothetical protein
MSLAIYAAPFDMDSSYVNTNKTNDSIINKKRASNNRTQKRYSKNDYNSEKVNSILQSIHNNTYGNEEGEMGDFNPPPPPTSIGAENTKTKESSLVAPQPQQSQKDGEGFGDEVDLNNLDSNYGNGQTAEEYYKKFIPNYQPTKNPHNRPYYQRMDSSAYNGVASGMGMGMQMHGQNSMDSGSNYDVLIEKLNYMINLLEEQQDEKTNNVTEEVVLYSFLGIFIIFIVDSFSRVGKYVR